MGRLAALAAILVVIAVATPGLGRLARAQTSACSGLLPVGVVQPPAGDFQTGCSYVYEFKLDPTVSTGGNFGFVDFPLCDQGPCAGMSPAGLSTARCLVANGYGCCVELGQVLATASGNSFGPFVQALETRWDADDDGREHICFADYTGNGQRLLYVPVTTPFPSGAGQVTVLGFAGAFMAYRPTGTGLSATLTLEFVPLAVPVVPRTWGRVKALYRD